MINTYSESSLHRVLKQQYATIYGGKTEIQEGKYICDIIANDNTIIEIQTANLHSLSPKLLELKEKHKILTVHPLITEKRIETYDTEGNLLSSRKSPKKENWINLFRHLRGIYKYLEEDWFTLEVIKISMIEKRIKTEAPVQLKNKSRRFKRNWYKTDKQLLEIFERKTFHTRKDYLELLPAGLPEEFSSADLKDAGCKSEANIILWVLKKAGFITQTCTKNRRYYYKINNQSD